MARNPFPTGGASRAVSDNIYQANHTADVPSWAAQGAASAAEGFSRRLRRLADSAYEREGLADAAAAVNASRLSGSDPSLRDGFGVDDEAYNGAIREELLAKRQEVYLEGLSRAEAENPDNVAAFGEAAAAHRMAFDERPTGDAQIDLKFSQFRVVQDAAALRRIRVGEQRRRVETTRGAFVNAVSTAETALGQAIASAGFDDDGAQLVGASLTQFAGTLARFGPREAFSIGGVDFADDRSRLGVVAADDMARLFGEVQAGTRTTWILNAASRAPDAASKQAFAGQVQERWAAGDPMFAGLDAAQMRQLGDRLEAEASRASADEGAARRAAGEAARDMLRAYEYGGDVDLETMRAQAVASGDVGLVAEIDYRQTYGFKVSPRDDAGPAGAGFDGWVPFLLDRLEGPGLVANDNGAGRAQWGITEQSHPQAWRDGRIDRAEASAIYRREYWDAIGGDRLPPELAFVAASAAVVGGVGTARELLAQAGGDAERFLHLEEARFRRLARENPEKYGDDLEGWLARQGRIRGALGQMRAQRRAQDGYASDPIGFARGTRTRPPLATVAEFNPAAVFEGGAAAWGEALRARQATGRELARRDGVPARMLASEEVAFYRDAFAEDPSHVVTFAAAATSALGGDGARALLGELGRGGAAPGDILLGSLATSRAHAPVVNRAVEGRRLRAEGAKDPKFEDDRTLADVRQAWAAELGLPEVLLAAQGVAADYAVADAATGRLGTPESYLNSALGAVRMNDRTYGGVVRINGQRTLAPPWLEAERLDDAVEALASGFRDPPVFTNGQRVPASVLATYRLRRMENGRYQLIEPRSGRAIGNSQGRAFELNFETDGVRDYLRRRLPGSVLPE